MRLLNPVPPDSEGVAARPAKGSLCEVQDLVDDGILARRNLRHFGCGLSVHVLRAVLVLKHHLQQVFPCMVVIVQTQPHGQDHGGMNRWEVLNQNRVEDAQDVELARWGQVGGVGQDGELDVHWVHTLVLT